MKYHVLVLVLVLAVLASADKPTKHKKYKRIGKPVQLEDPEVSELMQNDDDDDVFKMMEKDDEAEAEDKGEIVPPMAPFMKPDPCGKVHCGAGRICEVDSNGEPQCVCIPSCPVETESRRKVCSNHNETWPSDCSIYQQRCWCNKGDERCKGPNYKHIHIEYYGECRDMPSCTKEEMSDFPRRMRDWLFNIMRDLADRQELPEHYLKMEREAETNETRKWTNAAIWKWCDLDGHPHDRTVSRHELFPIRAPLMALEHCIAPFLNNCDENNDHRITLQEWAKCLEIDEDEIDDRCERIEDDQDV